MNEHKPKPERSSGEMYKRRETMADGKRYIIYYTFSETTPAQSEHEESEENANV